jgi:membrane protease YdiL (CAAX protease family)
VEISKIHLKDSFFSQFALTVAAWLVSYGGTYLVLSFIGIADQPYSNLIISSVFLFTTLGCIRLFRFSTEDLGLKMLRGKLASHVGLCLIIFIIYCLYYLLIVKISNLRPVNPAAVWGLLNFIVVAFAEEIYFRGLFYHLIDQRTSGRMAVLITGILFGLVHFQQGLGMLPKFFTGWLWGSVRYATRIIFLLIFPLHFTYNAVWFMFEGRWGNPTILAQLFPLVELILSVLIVYGFKTTSNLKGVVSLWDKNNPKEVDL